MSEAEHRYMPPEVAAMASLPAVIAQYLDGTDLRAKTQALRLSTVDTAGWPHASLLSAGEALALPPNCIRFAIFPQSTTAENLRRDGRLAFTLSLDGGMHELRMRARPLADPPRDVPLAFFEAALESARFHAAPYATVTSGVTFALHEPDAVLPRWQRQIAALRAAA
jgi:hypothetical protein